MQGFNEQAFVFSLPQEPELPMAVTNSLIHRQNLQNKGDAMPGVGKGPLRPVVKNLLAVLAFSVVLVAGGITLINQQTGSLPDVELATLNQQPANLPDIADGKPMVVNLWATWCPPCIREMPVLEQAQQHYPNITFVFANQGEHPETIQRFLQEQKLNLANVVSDQKGGFGQIAGSHGLPTTLFYSAEGRLVDSHMGQLSTASLTKNLSRFDPAYLNESTPASAD